MKIGFFTETYLPHLNGVSISLEFAKKQLEKRGHDVYIFTPKISGYSEKQKKVIRLSSLKVLSAGHEQRIVVPIPNETFRKMLTSKLDLVHGHGGGLFSFLGYQFSLAKGYPFVLTYHAFIARYTHYFLNGRFVSPKLVELGSKLFCNRADIVIVPSQKMKRELLSYGVSVPIEIVPNSIDLERFGRAEKGFLRKKLNLKNETVILLTVSRLGKEKNVDFLIASFAKIAKKERTSILIIVGDGRERKRLGQMVENLKLEKRVIFTGVVSKDKMPEVYADADVFLFASTSETQGMVVPEAAATGLPVVLVKDEAFTGVVEDGRNGFEVDEKESKFAEKVLELISDSEKRRDFGRFSKKLVQENFSTEKNIQKLIAVYETAIKIRKGKPRLSNRLQGRIKDLIALFKADRELNRRLDLE